MHVGGLVETKNSLCRSVYMYVRLMVLGYVRTRRALDNAEHFLDIFQHLAIRGRDLRTVKVCL